MKSWMYIKEITKLCNWTESTLQKWIEKRPKISERLVAKIKKALQDSKSVRFSVNQVVMVLQAAEKTMIAELLQENNKNQSKVEAFDHFMDSHGFKTMNQVAKEINTGLKRLFEFLRRKKVLFFSGTTNLPYQRYIRSGYYKVKGITVKKDKGYIPYCQIFVTPKGEKRIAELWRKQKHPKKGSTK